MRKPPAPSTADADLKTKAKPLTNRTRVMLDSERQFKINLEDPETKKILFEVANELTDSHHFARGHYLDQVSRSSWGPCQGPICKRWIADDMRYRSRVVRVRRAITERVPYNERPGTTLENQVLSQIIVAYMMRANRPIPMQLVSAAERDFVLIPDYAELEDFVRCDILPDQLLREPDKRSWNVPTPDEYERQMAEKRAAIGPDVRPTELLDTMLYLRDGNYLPATVPPPTVEECLYLTRKTPSWYYRPRRAEEPYVLLGRMASDGIRPSSTIAINPLKDKVATNPLGSKQDNLPNQREESDPEEQAPDWSPDW